VSYVPITRLAICGWTATALDAVAALETTGAFECVAIGDHSAAKLVRARQQSRRPCFQQPAEMLRTGDFDAVLFATSEDAEHLAPIAAARGMTILVPASELSGAVLTATADAAARHDTRLLLLNPARHDAGVADLTQRITTHHEWSPAYLDITVEAPTDASELIAVAASHLVTLAGAEHLTTHLEATVRATAWGSPARAISATIEVSGGATPMTASLRARHAPSTFIRIAGDSPAGAFDLRIQDGEADLAFTSSAFDHVRYAPAASDAWLDEAERIADPQTIDDIDEARALGALLDVIQRSIATEEAQTTVCCAAPALRVIRGSDEGLAALPRPRSTARLQLVHA